MEGSLVENPSENAVFRLFPMDFVLIRSDISSETAVFRLFPMGFVLTYTSTQVYENRKNNFEHKQEMEKTHMKTEKTEIMASEKMTTSLKEITKKRKSLFSKRKRLLSICLSICLIISLCACTSGKKITDIPLATDLPVIHTEEPYYDEKLPDNAEKEGLVKTYTSKSDDPDIFVYNIPAKKGETLQSFGQKQAEKHGVFCDIIQKDKTQSAVLNYYQREGDDHFIIQEYIYISKNRFVKVDYRYKTVKTPLGTTGLNFRLIRGYDEEDRPDSDFSYNKKYSTEKDDLPDVRVCQFAKKDFADKGIRKKYFRKISQEQFDNYAENGWTLKEILKVYKKNYDVKKGEFMNKNDHDIAFIGFIQDGIFYVRAFINCGSDIVMFGCEKEAAKFRHMTNAYLDSIE